MGSDLIIWGKDKINMIVFYEKGPEPGHVWGESGTTDWFFRTYYKTNPFPTSSGEIDDSSEDVGRFEEEEFEQRKGALTKSPSPSAEVKTRSKDRHGHNDKYEEKNEITRMIRRDRKRSSN